MFVYDIDYNNNNLQTAAERRLTIRTDPGHPCTAAAAAAAAAAADADAVGYIE